MKSTKTSRVITRTEIPSMKRTSHGLIVVCPSTGTTLLVQLKNHPEFLHFIRGSFSHDQINAIVSNRSPDENEILKSLVDPKLSLADVEAILFEHISILYDSNEAARYYKSAAKRIYDERKSIREAVYSIPCRQETPWLWPKGRQDSAESRIKCAIRETLEEAGVRVEESRVDIGSIIPIDQYSYFGVMFRTEYYFAIVDSELPFEQSCDEREIKQVEWVSIANLDKKLSTVFKPAIEKVKLLLESHREIPTARF